MSTLYRKYRPVNFSEMVGQKHVVQTLSNAIKNQKIVQAYLFSGPRGTGKTSVARILAKTVNCLQLKNSLACGKCSACKIIEEKKSLDILEIDAASNTGVDNIRELRETVSLPPTSLKYKVYIIDEVHMLSMGAFNALLKTLEEPPAHVIFILATTEIHKVPETIISRCQRFDFVRLPIADIIEKLSRIAKKEGVKIDKDALEMIAISAEGGMRDAESLLSQIISLEDKKITLKEVEEILGTAGWKATFELAEKIIQKDCSGAIDKINSLTNDGYDLEIFIKSLVNHFRQLMILNIDPELKKTLSRELTQEQIDKVSCQTKEADLENLIKSLEFLLEAQNEISSSLIPQLPLEIAIIKATGKIPFSSKNYDLIIKTEEENKPSVNQKNSAVQPDSPKETDAGKNFEMGEENEKVLSLSPSSSLDLDDVRSRWGKLITDIRPFNHSLNALLSNCQAIKVENQEITIATPYDFYKEKLNIHSNRLTIEEIFSKILGLKICVKVVVDKNLKIKSGHSTLQKNASPEPEKKSRQDSLIDSALEILGGKVIEN